MRYQLIQLLISTRDGIFAAHYSGKGLAGLTFPAPARTGRRRGSGAPRNVPAVVRRWHQKTVAALKRALAGRTPGTLPPLAVSNGTAFQRRVWHAMRKIACGQTQSYGEIARAIGKPKAIRAVGGACGANSIPVLIPCHRVLAAERKIGGFSGGLKWKRTLLAREGAKFQ